MVEQRVELRELRQQDAERLFLWRRRPEVDRWMCGRPAATLDEHLVWFDAFRDGRDCTGWIIAWSGRPVGFVMLKSAGTCDNRAEWGWYLGEDDARGRGVGRAAQALALDRAFGELGLHKITAEVLADNTRALKAQTAAGFRREGYMRAHALKDGAHRDVVLLGLLADDWRALRPAYVRELAEARLIAA